jgi:hypothetical protein
MGTGERALAEMHINQLAGLESFEEWKELILFDRGYPSFELIQGLLERKIHYAMRVREKFSVAIDRLGLGDHSVELKRGNDRIAVRVIKFLLPSGTVETLITDMTDQRLGADDFKALYFKRWPIETKYDQIKNKLAIENLSGMLADNIRQDFYAAMILTNLAAEFLEEAQKAADNEREEKENRWQYKINVNHAIGVFKDGSRQTHERGTPDMVESSSRREDERPIGMAGNGGGSEATSQGKASDERHNRHRVLCGTCKCN